VDTSVLRSFAVASRVGLLRDVSARLVGVLAPGSPERVEVPGVVAALEAAIAAAGGGDVGQAAVVDRVAYTWFNRVVALRFMDANGFTGVGVVSPPAGQSIGQPEVLADAKAGQIDGDVVSAKGRELIQGLLSGSRKSSDAQGEAYGVLLAEYCRHWNRVMPFMFERAGDFTELLIPSNLLAPDSLLAKANEVMTSEVCADVEVIGWLYQFYISERKDEVFAGFKKGKKAGAEEIPAATQLFTPDWIVRYLVENSLGRLWILNNPGSKLADQMEYHIAPVDEETDFLTISSPEDLKIVDPACGSGHMLTYAFDLLYAIYEEAGYAPADIPGLILAKNLYGVEIDQRAGSLAAFALTMKARAKQRTFFTKDVQPNICVLQNVHFTPDELDELITRGGDRFAEEDFWQAFEHADTFGSLIQPDETLLPSLRMHVDQVTKTDQLFTQDLYTRAEIVLTQAEYLAQRYHILVANPPYMGSKNMDGQLAEFAQGAYPASKADLFAMFIVRSFSLVDTRGYSALVTMESWMFLQSFSQLRRSIVTTKCIASMVHMPYLGKGSTSMGINFGTSATVFRNCLDARARGTFQCVRHYETDGQGVPIDFPTNNEKSSCVRSSEFADVPNAVIAYAMPEWLRGLVLSQSTLAHYGDSRQGLITGDVTRFVRCWHEVSGRDFLRDAHSREESLESGMRWFPLNSGGEFRKWYGNHDLVIDWEGDGREIRNFHDSKGRLRSRPQNLEFMFRPSIGWSAVTSGRPAFRSYPHGFLFDNAGMSFFIDSRESQNRVLGFLNSSVVGELLELISPTMNLNAGQIASMPVADLMNFVDDDAVKKLVDISKRDWSMRETSWEFLDFPLIAFQGSVEERVKGMLEAWACMAEDALELERRVNAGIRAAASAGERADEIGLGEISLWTNIAFTYRNVSSGDRDAAAVSDLGASLVSYAVGCMFGRYSLDSPGLILADQGATLQDYLAKIPLPTFTPDADNVIPIVDGDWFEDDIVARFREFLRVAFGEEHFEENLRFITETLGVKDLRDFFVKSFYKDHVQRYKKRPIYWLFSSPKGSFNALIYMHRYNPSTVSTVLNEYLREYKAKLSASLQHHERLAVGAGSAKEQAAAAKEADRLRKVILELDEYEHDVLYPLASQQISIDLDDGVKVNYPKFGAALKKIPGLEASDE
jgi:hypothetical protein